jgi:hypothetical protein
MTEGLSGALVHATDELDYELFEKVLARLGAEYNWMVEESGGKDPLVPSSEPGYTKRLRYWAMLMSYWVKGDPLVLVISRTIAYHARLGSISYRDYAKSPYLITETFDSRNPGHINLIIEETMRDLETGLRFKIISYLDNYHDLSIQSLGTDNAGINIAKLVEYGSTDPKMINLQEVGFSRGVALDLLNKHSNKLTFTGEGELDAVDVEAILADSDLSDA